MLFVWCAADKKKCRLGAQRVTDNTLPLRYKTKKSDSVVQRISVFKYEHGIEIRFQIKKKSYPHPKNKLRTARFSVTKKLRTALMIS